MKKNGFTLAEVLITLAIIGVVATMTLPALMTNTAEQQARTGLKKGINTLTEIAQTNSALAGFDYASINNWAGTRTEEDALEHTIYGIFATQANMDLRNTDNIDSVFEHTDTFHLRDGAAILINQGTATAENGSARPQRDGLPLGFTVVYDTNGAKGPNILSNCNGESMGESEADDGQFTAEPGDQFDISSCNTKTNRIIKDQFTVRLRGAFAQPEGPAAVWVYGDVR